MVLQGDSVGLVCALRLALRCITIPHVMGLFFGLSRVLQQIVR